MKKNLIRGFALLAIGALVIIGCTNEENPVPTETSRDLLQKIGGGKAEFKNLLKDLYGASHSVSATPVVVTNKGEKFNAFKVTVNSNLEGYILETPKDNYYYENNKASRVVTEFDNTASGLVRNSFDLSENPYYLHHGLNPIVPANPVVAPLRFWGWEYRVGPCGPNSNGDGGFSSGVYGTHYIMWIGGTEQPVQNSSGTNISVPCTGTPPNLIPGTYP